MLGSTLPPAAAAPATIAEAASISTAELLRIVRTAGGALLLQAGLHGQLLRVEWAQEKARLRKLVMASLLGFVCLLGLLAALGTLLLAVYWDTPYRIRAVSALVAIYGLGVAYAWRLCRSQAALGEPQLCGIAQRAGRGPGTAARPAVTARTEPSLEAQRQALRIRLQAQRHVIARQLSAGSGATQAFPRSMTMRVLTQRPQLMYRVLGGVLGLLRLR